MSDRKEKLWIYSELFYPEETSTSYIMTKLANKLVTKYDVEVVSGYPSYDQHSDSTSLTLDSRIKLRRFRSYNGNKDQAFTRIVKLVSLSFSFFFHLLFKVKSGQKIFTVTNPATFLVFVSIVKIFKKIDVTILVHDVFPENTLAAGFIKSDQDLKYRLVQKIFNKAYSSFDHIIVLGRDMKQIFEKKLAKTKKTPVKISIIENWTDVHGIFPEKNFLKETDPIVFQFAGNLGSIQGLDSLIEIIGQIKNENIVFEFIGDGKMKPYLQNYAESHHLRNIIFKPPFSRSQQQEVLNSCDISIVCLADKMLGLGVPSKTYNILAAGKPILYIGDRKSEVALLIDEFEVGYHFEPAQKEKLLHFFNQINRKEIRDLNLKKGSNARNLAVTKFSEEVILNQFLNTI